MIFVFTTNDPDINVKLEMTPAYTDANITLPSTTGQPGGQNHLDILNAKQRNTHYAVAYLTVTEDGQTGRFRGTSTGTFKRSGLAPPGVPERDLAYSLTWNVPAQHQGKP